MQVITDIDPASALCPDPAASWMKWEPAGPLRRVGEAVFPKGAELYTTDEDGPKLTTEFPVVFWQEEARASQMETASRLADKLAASTRRLVFAASRGNVMRGHFGRTWAAEEGNLHATVLLCEPMPVGWVGMGYAALPVLALADCADGLTQKSQTARIKWINDIMLPGGKVGGSLSHTRSKGGMFTSAVFGMGLNTCTLPQVEPTPFVPNAANMNLDREKYPPLEVLRRLLSSLAANMRILERRGGIELVRRYRQRCESIGRRVRLYEDGPGLDDQDLAHRKLIARGKLSDLLDDMRLQIDGETFGSGRLVYEEDAP